MCGRYTLATAEEFKDLENIVNEVQHDLTAKRNLLTGDVYPTNPAPVLTCENQRILPRLYLWGFPGFQGKGVIINARAESALVKPMFSRALIQGRCVVPSAGFFEWDKAKQKYLFNLPDTNVLYMAGLVREFEGQRRFVILTTAANQSIAAIHDRMPVVLEKQDIEAWLSDHTITDWFLHRIPPALVKQAV